MAKKFFIKLQTPVIEMVVDAIDASGTKDSITIGFKRYPSTEIEEKINQFKDISEEKAQQILESEISYIKNAKLAVYEDDNYIEDIIIEDTRTASNELFQEGENILAILTEYYLASTPWKSSITNAYFKAIYNIDFKEAELKNS